ncbi:HAMP domain-containing histidine kinase [Olivibacter sp. SDN3]|nr:HAMP domain-containing histidine kinase [Olivibacter sp. SDN3]
MKIRTKIILLFSGIITLIITFFAIYASYFTWDSLKTKFFLRLEENARIVGTHTIAGDSYNTKMYYEVKRKYLALLSEGNDYLLRIAKGSTELRFDPNLPMPKSFYSEAITNGKAEYLHNDTAYFAMYFADSLHKDDLLVISSGRDSYGHAEQADLDKTLLSGGLIALALGIVIAFYFADHILTPIATINENVRQINISNLSLRLQNTKSHKHDEIANLINNFNDMLNRLQIAVKSQQNFIGNASHSLRTPLTVIGGEAEIVLQRLKEDKESQYSLEIIAREVDKMVLIVKNLLLLARTGYEGQIERTQIIRIDELLYGVKISANSLYSSTPIHFDFHAIPDDSQELHILANRDLLHVAVSNLVLNACKYGKSAPVVISLTVKNQQVVVTIKDEGIGIPEKELPHIFESFFRGSNTTGIYGNGLGLSLTKNILELHDIEVDVTSKVNEGTLVTLRIAIDTAPQHSG